MSDTVDVDDDKLKQFKAIKNCAKKIITSVKKTNNNAIGGHDGLIDTLYISNSLL